MVKRIKNDTINANNPVASAKANPRIAYEKSCPRRAGLRATPVMRLPNTVPIPAPAPMSPEAATPAPITIFKKYQSLSHTVSMFLVGRGWIPIARTFASSQDSCTNSYTFRDNTSRLTLYIAQNGPWNAATEQETGGSRLGSIDGTALYCCGVS